MQGMPIILFLQMREESPFALRACMGWVLQLIYCRVVHSQFKQSHSRDGWCRGESVLCIITKSSSLPSARFCMWP